MRGWVVSTIGLGKTCISAINYRQRSVLKERIFDSEIGLETNKFIGPINVLLKQGGWEHNQRLSTFKESFLSIEPTQEA